MKKATVDKQRNVVEIDGKKYEIGRELNEQTPSELFWSLLEGYETRTDFESYPGRIFFLVDGYIIMEFILINGDLWVNYEKIWRKFETEFGYNYEDVRRMVKDEVEEHFNLRGVTPTDTEMFNALWVEEHFNLRGVTPT